MKSIVTWGKRAFPAALLLLYVLFPLKARAADVSLTYGFGQPAEAAAIVAPKDPSTLVMTPVFATVQATTEVDSTRSASSGIEDTSRVAETQQLPRGSIGVDGYFSDRQKVINIPLAYSLFSDIFVQLNIPVMSAKYDVTGGTIDNTGIGDINVTLKHIYGYEDNIELYTLLIASLATGDENKGLGTGAYTVSLTEKAVKRFGDYRCTVMGALSLPLNKPTILGSKVEYGAYVSYMAAVERSFFLPNLWFGIRAAGVHSTESKIDGLKADNSLTTLDIIPGIRLLSRNNTALQLAVFIPAFTEYEVSGAADRDVVIHFGIVKKF